jgi:hypothetical protein
MALKVDQLGKLVGKTIKSIVVSDNNSLPPRCQVFLVFTDDTYYEFYGSEIHATHGPDQGDETAAIEYAEKFAGSITTYR